jgi:uncharacterized protein (TIGR02594 family)
VLGQQNTANLQNMTPPDLKQGLLSQTQKPFQSMQDQVVNKVNLNNNQPGPSLLSNAVNQAIPNPQQLSLPSKQPTGLLGQVMDYAKQAYPNNPVMQQVMATQAAHESGLLGSPSKLATQNNNLFGMTGVGDKGSRVLTGNLDTKQQQFASYSSPTGSMEAYQHLMDNPRYKDVVSAKTPQEAFQALQKAGYATDPHYAESLNNVYNKIDQTYSIGRASTAASNPNASAYDVAQSYIGQGRNNHADVLEGFFSKSLGQNVNIKNTPWCAAFANSVLMTTGHPGTGSLAARSFLQYGTPTDKPTQGDLVVMSRGGNTELGHVGFYAGMSDDGTKVKVLGGNQSGQVMIKEYPVNSVLGYRTPPTSQELQQMNSNRVSIAGIRN